MRKVLRQSSKWDGLPVLKKKIKISIHNPGFYMGANTVRWSRWEICKQQKRNYVTHPRTEI